MDQTSSAQVPPTANVLNPEAMHAPTGYTHVVEVTAGRPVSIAGQVALDPAGQLVGPGDIRAQARKVFDNLQAALQAVGASFQQVVKLTIHRADATRCRPFARSATSTSTPSSRRPAPLSRSRGWSSTTSSSRSKRSRWSHRSSP
jgi:enamine deaminase RidA (YjgF/YER057c/UK114 family)